MMKKYLLFVYILLVIFGCGAQQKNDIKEVRVDTNFRVVRLPHSISIKFPLEILKLNHMSFHEDIESIDKEIIELKSYILSIKSIFPNIVKYCEGEDSCHYRARHGLAFKKIDFFKHSKNSEYNYKLLLTTDISSKIVLQWRADNSKVLTKYSKISNDLLLHYFDDLVGEKALYINNNRETEHIGMLLHTKEKDKIYHLISNHIKLKNDSYSSNILLQNDELIEYNENVFLVNSLTNNLNSGDFLLLNTEKSVKELNFIEKLKYLNGLFSIFEKKSQGFLNNYLSSEKREKLELFHLK